jgi:hypothetical protein
MVLVKLHYYINLQGHFQSRHAKIVLSGPLIEILSERLSKKSSFSSMSKTKSLWKTSDSLVAYKINTKTPLQALSFSKNL